MTAGKGILHLEDAPESVTAHTLQLWINFSAEYIMTNPGYRDIAHSTMLVLKKDRAVNIAGVKVS